jgi:hypothetical protein
MVETVYTDPKSDIGCTVLVPGVNSEFSGVEFSICDVYTVKDSVKTPRLVKFNCNDNTVTISSGKIAKKSEYTPELLNLVTNMNQTHSCIMNGETGPAIRHSIINQTDEGKDMVVHEKMEISRLGKEIPKLQKIQSGVADKLVGIDKKMEIIGKMSPVPSQCAAQMVELTRKRVGVVKAYARIGKVIDESLKYLAIYTGKHMVAKKNVISKKN